MKSLLAGGAIIATSILGVGASASAQAPLYPPQPPVVNITLNLSVTVVIINGGLNLTFIGCQAGENVLIAFNGSSTIVSCTGSGGGAAAAALTAPSTPGVFPITAVGLESGDSATEELTVVGGASGLETPTVGGASGFVERAAAMPGVAGRSGAVAQATTGSASLPATGSQSNQTLWIAGSTLLAGLGLAGVGLRRRQHTSAS